MNETFLQFLLELLNTLYLFTGYYTWWLTDAQPAWNIIRSTATSQAPYRYAEWPTVVTTLHIGTAFLTNYTDRSTYQMAYFIYDAPYWDSPLGQCFLLRLAAWTVLHIETRRLDSAPYWDSLLGQCCLLLGQRYDPMYLQCCILGLVNYVTVLQYRVTYSISGQQ